MELISIIIPVYNASKYISKCIKSILRQSYCNFELILIDDGSTDNSLKICEKFAFKDNRVKVFHKSNSGVSATRNIGIKMSNGKYLMFVDSDDWLQKGAIKSLRDIANSNDSDIVCGSTKVYGNFVNGNIVSKDESFEKDESVGMWLRFIANITLSPWAKLFKSEIILSNNLHFSETIKSGEDTIFLLEYLNYCKKVSSTSKRVYNYNQFNQFSATRKYFPQYNDWMTTCVQKYKVLCDEIKNDESKKLLSIIAKSFLNAMCQHCIRYMNAKSDEKIKTIKDAYSRVSVYIIDDDYAPSLEKYSLEHNKLAETLSEENGPSIVYNELTKKWDKNSNFKVRLSNFLRTPIQLLKLLIHYGIKGLKR